MKRNPMQAPEAQPIKVFLVDDHKTVLWGLQRLIESVSPQMVVVGTAENRADLFAKLAGAKPDVILLDLDLGGSSSLDFLEKLGEQTSAQVLVLTGSSDPSVHQRAVVRGARGVVNKQVSSDILLQAIEKVHQGEVWLDRAALGHVMTTLARGNVMDPDTAKMAELTAKERQIVAMLVEEKGGRNKLIADRLHMSEHTLRNHLTTIYSKLGVEGRMELYLFASKQQQHGADT